MLKIKSKDKMPTVYNVDKSAKFQPGMVAQLKIKNNKIVCATSNGFSPIGLIDDIKTNTDSTVTSGRITVWNGSGLLFESSVYQKRCLYQENDNLFVSRKGLLTTKRPSKNHPPFAVVTKAPTSVYLILEAKLL